MVVARLFLREELGGLGVGFGGLAKQFIGRGLLLLARLFILGRTGAFADDFGPFAVQLGAAQLGLGGIATRSYSSAVRTAKSKRCACR